MGMALRARVAAGWWSFRFEWCVWYDGMKAGEFEFN